MKNKTYHRKKIVVLFFICFITFLLLSGRLVYLMVNRSEYYTMLAKDLHERERKIKAARGCIIDATGEVLATNQTVCTISVIHNQIKDPDKVIDMLVKELQMDEAFIQKRIEKKSSIERIRSNVSKEIGDRIRAYEYPGVKVDEDYKRFYPYDTLASKALGFTGGDNQGIIGLEVIYEEYLKGIDGTILTVTDAKGVEVQKAGEDRIEPISGNNLNISLDINVQEYATQLAKQTMATKNADGVSMLVMNPQNGEIIAMVDVPEFSLNNPFTLPEGVAAEGVSEKEKQNLLNNMWRNGCINDTYEPGSAFKIITAAAGLEAGVVTQEDTFHCPGFVVVEDRKIRCHKVGGHGTQTFAEGVMNSCNPVFVTVGMRLGVEDYYKYFKKFGLLTETNVDLPGEAGTIMHKKKNMGPVELATVSFGQSFQLTPIQLLTTAASIVNGGNRITPHIGVKVTDDDNHLIKTFEYPVKKNIVSEETSEMMQFMLEQVVEKGSGKKAFIEGFHIGGKTATSETLPRGSGKYIASFLGFAPADNPKVMAIVIIENPKGVYYGGQIAAPVIKQLFENILPYLEQIDYNK